MLSIGQRFAFNLPHCRPLHLQTFVGRLFATTRMTLPLVLMEDAEGEVLSLTEEYPSNDHFQAWIRVSDSSFTSCKPLAFRFCLLRVTKCTDVWQRCLTHQIAGILNIFRPFSSLLWFNSISFCVLCQCPCQVNKFVTAKKHVSDAKRGTAAWQRTLFVDWHMNFSWGWKNISCRVTFGAGTGASPNFFIPEVLKKADFESDASCLDC